MTTVIEVKDLSKSYGEVQAVSHVNLSVEKGALFGLLGPNGSGKTTMIKMLTGQTRPTSGTATVLGIDVVTDPVGVRGQVGIIPEQETPPSFLTAMEYLGFVAAVRKIPDIEKKADWWFDFLDFADKKECALQGLIPGHPSETDVHAGLYPRAGARTDRRAPDQLRPDHAGPCQRIPCGVCQEG